MSKSNGGPAFPAPEAAFAHFGDPAAYPGVTVRDYFAAKALPGVLYMVAHGVHDAASSAEGCALEAYKLADAMLKAREA
jgi:hypothetical protein